MSRKFSLNWKTIFVGAVIVLGLGLGGLMLIRESSKAFGGGFGGPLAQQQTGRYQIAGRDSNSAWVIDTVMGDVYMIYANGKWKDVGSIMEEKNRIKN